MHRPAIARPAGAGRSMRRRADLARVLIDHIDSDTCACDVNRMFASHTSHPAYPASEMAMPVQQGLTRVHAK